MSDLEQVESDGTTGTTVWFRPGPRVAGLTDLDLAQLADPSHWVGLIVVVHDRRSDR